MESSDHREKPNTRRRTLNACTRCRQHKIKCSGTLPCATCTKRGLHCVFGTRQSYSQSYVRDLERRLAVTEQRNEPMISDTVRPSTEPRETTLSQQLSSERPTFASRRNTATNSTEIEAPSGVTTPSVERIASNEPIINPLAGTGRPFYLLDVQGRAIYLGTSSNWSFSRRVLQLAHESIMKTPLTPNSLLWEGKAYNLGWNGERPATDANDGVVIPQADFGIYLVNSVKFYVGQIFHLFDEDEFMEKLNRFYSGVDTEALIKSIWYNHFLLLLAFGKAFVTRGNTKDSSPPGGAFFVKAMSTLPNLIFADTSSFETVEVLCCASLYLHCIDMRCAAYKMIGQAVRTALDRGMHTSMQHLLIPEHTLERSRRVWWTAVILDRHVSALCGLPLSIRDDDISAPLPTFGGSKMRALALTIHARLSRIMAMIVNNVYGREGRQSSKFLIHTKTALEEISTVMDELNSSFELSLNDNMQGISRVSAYLHILLHQCVILATRPILLNFLEARLARPDQPPKNKRPSESIWSLLLFCKDSALHTLRILSALQTQGLLENFLSFDLDATIIAVIVLQMAAHIDPPLLKDDQQWVTTALSLMEEMSSRGNLIAANLQQEIERLRKLLDGLPQRNATRRPTRLDSTRTPMSDETPALASVDTIPSPILRDDQLVDWLSDSHDQINAEQMKLVANSIDLDGLEWWFDKDYDSVMEI